MKLLVDPYLPGGTNQTEVETPRDIVRLSPERSIFYTPKELPREGIAGQVLMQSTTGLRKAEDLRRGDVLLTATGEAELAFVWHEIISADETAEYPSRRAVRIAAGALGAEQPAADVIVGPDHLIEFETSEIEVLFGQRRATVKARDLIGLPGIETARDTDLVLVHLVFDADEAPLSAGLGVASATLSPDLIASLPEDVRDGLLFELPKLAMTAGFAGYDRCGLLLDGHEARTSVGPSTFAEPEAMVEAACQPERSNEPALSVV